MSGAPTYSGTYQLAPYNTNRVPDYVDGLRVTTTVLNPTTFAKAMPGPSENVRVSAVAAARLYATCPPEPGPEDSTLPFTRFRPALEIEMYTKGNDPCNPYIFWESNNDVQTSNNAFKNIVSFNQYTINGDKIPADTEQLIDDYDERQGPVVGDPYIGNCPGGGDWPDCGMYNFVPGPGWTGNLPPYCGTEPCTKMPGSGQNNDNDGKQDVMNWLYWQWRGALSLDNVWISGRPGDWAEVYDAGNWGNAIHDSVGYLARDWGTNSYFSGPPLNWGRAVTRTVYLWGEGLPVPQPGQVPDPNGYLDTQSTQYLKRIPCSPNPCNDTYEWRDVQVFWNNGPRRFQSREGSTGPTSDVDRVRFTDKRTFVFYQALNGNGNVTGPGGCNIQVPTSAAMGFFPSTYVPGPSGDNCPTGWVPGTGVYSRVIDPNAP
jgi:hypothetical protein